MKTAPTALERTNRRQNQTPTQQPKPQQSAEGSQSGEGVAEGTDVAAGAPRRRFKEVWLVEDRKEGKSIWTRVGVAFENADGSWNIRLSALPVGSGRLNMRDPLERDRSHGIHGVEQGRVAA